MNSIWKGFFTLRVILGILFGATISIVLIFLIRNYLLATILGMMVAALFAHLFQPKDLAILGLVVGSPAGIFWGARNYLMSGEARINYAVTALMTAMLGGLVLTAFVCAVYGFILGKLRVLYKQGRGPFF